MILNFSCLHPKVYPWTDYFSSGGSEDIRNGALNVMDFSINSSFENIGSYQSDHRALLITPPIWSGVGGFIVGMISLFPISFMCLIRSNIDMLYWIFVINILLSLWAVIAWTLLRFPVSCWIDTDSIICWDVVGYLLPMISIHKLDLFILVKAHLQIPFLLIGRYRTCCDSHIIGQQLQYKYLWVGMFQ